MSKCTGTGCEGCEKARRESASTPAMPNQGNVDFTKYSLDGDYVENAHIFHEVCGHGEIVENLKEAVDWAIKHQGECSGEIS